MKYEAANEFLKKRLMLPTELHSKGIADALPPVVRAHCFFSARVAEARVLQQLRKVSDAFSRGDLGLAEARTQLQKWLDNKGIGDPSSAAITNISGSMRLNLILRQNAAMAAAVGRYQVSRDPDIEERWPSWKYITGSNPRPEHAALNGRIFLKSDPFWKTHYPPWDFGCNCDVEDSDEKPQTPPQMEPSASGYSFDPADAFREFDMSSIEDEKLRKRIEDQMRKKFGKIDKPEKKEKAEKLNSGKVLKPSGTPVGNALEIQVGDKKLKTNVNHAVEIINSVHGDGELMQTPISGKAPGGGALGCFTRYGFAGHVSRTEIRIARSGGNQCMTTIHEIGHLIDAFGLGDGFTTGAQSAILPEVKHWLNTVMQTPSYRQIVEKKDKHSAYLQNPKELWARCYAQYIARKSKDPVLLAELDKMINCEYNKIYHAQWSDEEFPEIMTAMDQIFIAKGWLK